MTEAMLIRTTVAARVAEQLRAEIRQGALAAGEPLRQNDIAARLGVSSTPVREAFQILERLGLVEREGRRGVRVFRPSKQNLLDAYEVRGGLESLAASLAAGRLDDSALAAITTTMDQMHAAGVSQSSFLRLNAEFHAQIARGSGNERLANLVSAEQAATASFVAFLGVDQASADEARGEHAAILSALAARNAAAAAATMSAHLIARAAALGARLDAETA